MKKKPPTRRHYALVAAVCFLSAVNPFNFRWFESQGISGFYALLLDALVFAIIFVFLMWAFGFYRKAKN